MTDRSKQTGEVFTPLPLVAEMLMRLPREVWSDPTRTFIDDSAGDGNFLYAAKHVLMAGLRDALPDPAERERHILEEMLFAVEIMPDNVRKLQVRLGWLVEKTEDVFVPNPILDREHFRPDRIDHEPPVGEWKSLGGVIVGPGYASYLHHRNVVCADALQYDHTFGRR